MSARHPVTVSADDAQLILEALAELPFKTVFEVIGTLNRAVAEQWHKSAGQGASLQLHLGAAELKVVMHALGELPYRRVFALVARLQAQLTPAAGPPDTPAMPAARATRRNRKGDAGNEGGGHG